MEPRPHIRQPSRYFDALQAYLASGWLFFLPYLAVYLFFWGTGASVDLALSIFWTLHAFHLAAVLAVALKARRIFRDPRLWFFVAVALVFLMQGVYLEFPGDNWTHAQRIFLWENGRCFSEIPDYYEKYKSGFFFLHSLIGWVPLHARVAALSLCAALMAALLCYQVWRMLKACGLGDTPALIGVLASLLFTGTPIQFHAYYSISSSVPSMIGAFGALTALLAAPRHRLLLWFLACTLATFNHLQGTVITLLGTAAIVCWRAQIRLGNAKLFSALGATAILAFAAAALFLTQSQFGTQLWAATGPLRDKGWISQFGLIRIWDFSSLGTEGPATRFLEIVTWLGLLNFAAAAVLIWKRRVLGWISLAPLAAVLYPVSATLIAYLHRSGDNIITYHRYFLLVIPLAALIDLVSISAKRSRRLSSLSPLARASAASAAATIILFAAIPDQRHWLGKLRDLAAHHPEVGRLDFLIPAATQLDADPRFDGRIVALVSDPATSTFLSTHLGFYSNSFRLSVNDSSNTVFGDPSRIAAAIAEFPPPVWTICVIVPSRTPDLPLHYSPTGAMTRHWRSFAIGGNYQFDPAILAWCDQNLTDGWESFDLGSFHRCYVRLGYKEP